jgi:pyrimidine operon attenuation protein/uracil phosphoribosyltransferase
MNIKQIMNQDEMKRAFSRIAHEMLERIGGPSHLSLIGVHTRGFPIAMRLAKLINDFEGVQIPVGCLDITTYRDDSSIKQNSKSNLKNFPILNFEMVDQKHVILVDDVLFTGRSIRAAMDAIIDIGRPETIQLAVLIDRGHKQLPIRADYVGKNVPSALSEKIQVSLLEVDFKDEVSLQSNN